MGWPELVARRSIGAAEGLDGPFFEPKRPHPRTSIDEARAAADRLESLLARMVRARNVSFLYPVALAILLAAAGAPAGSLSACLGLAAFGLAVGLFDHWMGTGPFTDGRSATYFILAMLGPPLSDVVDAGRGFHDAVRGLTDAERTQLLGSLDASHPLVASAARSSTLIPSGQRTEIG